MVLNSDNLQYVVGGQSTLCRIRETKPFPPFAGIVVDFLNALSAKLLMEGRSFSDVVTFAFWCRRASVLKMAGQYDDLRLRFGRGVAFHSTPSNVAVNFAFSLAAGLLSGNANIVRLPAKQFAQVDIICDAVRKLLETEFRELEPYIVMVKFGVARDICDFMSSICDVRVVWGGDATIKLMRESPLPPRAIEITFADRHSLLVIDADEYLRVEDKRRIAIDFYNDTYLTDQNACTSPRVVVWLGERKSDAKRLFWEFTREIVSDKYKVEPVQATSKLAAFYRAATALPIHMVHEKDSLFMRVKVDAITEKLMDYKFNSGFFFEYDADSLDEIAPLCTKKCQTLTYYGVSKEMILEFMNGVRPYGMDRAVSIGKSMDFTLVWDGFDLIREMSRRINIV